MLRRLALLTLVASAAASAQDAGLPARVLVAEAYDVVLGGQAFGFGFDVALTTPDTTLRDAGHAVTALDAESASARFRLAFDAGEIQTAALTADAFRVAMPRTQTVYVDSSKAEVTGGTVGLLMLHPAFGAALYSLAADAQAEVVGPDSVAGAACTRARYVLTLDAEGNHLALDVCFDAATGLPSEIVYRDSGGIEARMTFADLAPVGSPSDALFALDAPPGWRTAPYDPSGLPVLAIGDPAPGFALVDASGETVTLDAFRGQTVLVDFWGTWCAPCVTAIPHVQEIADTYPDLVVLGLAAYEDDATDPAAFARQRGGRYPVLRADQATVDAWRVHAFPTYVVVAPDGSIAFVAVEDREPDAQAALDAFLAQTLR